MGEHAGGELPSLQSSRALQNPASLQSCITCQLPCPLPTRVISYCILARARAHHSL